MNNNRSEIFKSTYGEHSRRFMYVFLSKNKKLQEINFPSGTKTAHVITPLSLSYQALPVVSLNSRLHQVPNEIMYDNVRRY